ncbi:MAG: metal-dependent phosphohydrolase [Denitromonas halophila]|nr:MAG: metal-dependent phosphohydrolase [Denitromonas halophila]
MIEAAIWFHDAIYDPARRDNEARSADLATECLSGIGWPGEACRRVASLVQMTAKHATPPDDGDAALLMDLDLSIFATEPDAYDEYVIRIRREYAHVPDGAFRDGRQAFVDHLLARSKIYTTPVLFETWEPMARCNLDRERRTLSRG